MALSSPNLNTEFESKVKLMNAKISGTPRLVEAGNDVSIGLRVVAMFLRAVFMATLLAVIIRVAAPQSESIWSVYETPGDLVRLILGVLVGVWVLFHLFMLPKDPGAYRTWVYLGLLLAPFAVALTVAIW